MRSAFMSRSSRKNHPYEAQYFPEDSRMQLYHYGTLIYEDIDGEITRLGGWSASDRDAISTAMSFSGIQGYVSNSDSNKKYASGQMDGWYLISNTTGDVIRQRNNTLKQKPNRPIKVPM